MFLCSPNDRVGRLLLGSGLLLHALLAFAAAPISHEDALAINPHLSLHAVLQQVVALHPQQALLNAHQHMVAARRTMANSLLPQSPAIGVSHQSDAWLSRRNEREWQAQLQIPIWLPGQRQARSQVADLAEESLGLDRAGLQQLAAELLRNRVWEVALRRNEVDVYQQRLDTLRSIAEDVKKRFRAGEVARIEVMQSEQEVLLAERQALTAIAEQMHAQFRYQQLTGLHEIPARLEEPLSPLQDFSTSAFWLAAQARLKLAEGQRDLIMIEHRQNPVLTLNTRTMQGAFDQQFNHSLGVGISIPLSTEVTRAPQLANAEQSIGDTRSQLDTLRRALEMGLHEAEHTLEVSRQELLMIERQHALSRENAALARKAYRVGELELSQLLRLQLLAFEAERSLQNQQLQVQWNIAKYNQAVGVLP